MHRRGSLRRPRPRMALLLPLALSTLAVTASWAPVAVVARAAPATWDAGAAALTITPPAYNPADDARDFPLCDTTVFSGARLFDFEEPYIDKAGTGSFDAAQDPYCDANHNGRWDGVYTSGGVARLTTWVLDDIWARALAISDGTHTVVIESVTSQGLGLEDTNRIRSALLGYVGSSAVAAPVTDVIVSSTHNESSPDPIGIYGAPADPTGTFGLHSGIDDYYISYLVSRAAAAGKQAVDSLTAARMRVGEFHPPDVRARLSTSFLTTDSNPSITSGAAADGTAEATDTKALVVQLVDAATGNNIETLFNWAAHNQQTGHASGDAVAPDSHDHNTLKSINASVSDDWPGVFSAHVESALGGHAMFVVGDNGSIEEPHQYPQPNPDAECPVTDYNPPRSAPASEGCATLPRTTGTRLANDVLDLVGTTPTLGTMTEVAPHALASATAQFNVPLQNQLFDAAFAAGIFAHHTATTATACQDSTGAARTCFLTQASLVDLGPQLQVLVNPGEAYPALVQGHPFGREQVSCPERPQPPTPAWHDGSEHRIEVGLGNDMIGYEIPAPGWFADSAVYTDPACPAGSQAQSNPAADYDQYNNYHKLESESVGPDGGSAVAAHLAALGDCAAAGTLASCTATAATCQAGARTIEPGRFLMQDGSLTRRGRDGPVGIWVLPCGSSTFTPGTGTLIALPGISAFGATTVSATGVFMDFDGTVQSAPDINTRGMLVRNGDGSVSRYFVDPYPTLSGNSPGAAVGSPQVPESPGGTALLVAVGAVTAWGARRARRRSDRAAVR